MAPEGIKVGLVTVLPARKASSASAAAVTMALALSILNRFLCSLRFAVVSSEVTEKLVSTNCVVSTPTKGILFPDSAALRAFVCLEIQDGSLLERLPLLDFPSSVVEFFQGYLGQPVGGFPESSVPI